MPNLARMTTCTKYNKVQGTIEVVLSLKPYVSPSFAPEAMLCFLSCIIVDKKKAPTSEMRGQSRVQNWKVREGHKWKGHFFCPNLSFNLSPPPLAGVVGVAETGVFVAV